MSNKTGFLLLVLLLTLASIALAGEPCWWYPHGILHSKRAKYCSHGCCHEYSVRSSPCCAHIHLKAGAIAGIVLGAVFFFAFLSMAGIYGRRWYHDHYTTVSTYTAQPQEDPGEEMQMCNSHHNYPPPNYPPPNYPAPNYPAPNYPPHGYAATTSTHPPQSYPATSTPYPPEKMGPPNY